MKLRKPLTPFENIISFVLFIAILNSCKPTDRASTMMKNDLRAPAYPLVTIDPYTCAWSFNDKLYEGSVKHWTGQDFPFLGAIRIDGTIYRFMGEEKKPLIPIVTTAEQGPWAGVYTFHKPQSGWEKQNFDDSQWEKGQGAFGTREETAVQLLEVCRLSHPIPLQIPKPVVNTIWEGENTDIWVRREVMLENDLAGQTVFLEYSHDDDFELYINGIEVVNTGYSWGKNIIVPLSEKVLQTLKKGRNIIAAHCRNRTNGALVDFGLTAEEQVKCYLSNAAEQQSADVQATQTHYTFVCGPMELELTFTSPLLMNDLDLLSRPVNYISYQVKSLDNKEHQVETYFEAAPNWALNKPYQKSQSEIVERDQLTFLKTGSENQLILCEKGDNVRIDWGYFYLCGEKEISTCAVGNGFALRNNFNLSGMLQELPTEDGQNNIAIAQSLGKVKKSASGKVLIGYDDIYSIQYFGKNLRPYWNTNGEKDILDVFNQAYKDYPKVIKACNEFDYGLMNEAKNAGGKDYADLCALAYRQAIAAHKLVKSPNGELLFLSKENFSNGSIGTVDVTYPSAPLFLLYNTELAKALLNHIFEYCQSENWSKPFAAHDIGTYPLANGQTYGGDMPVEETGNMLILTAAIAMIEGNADYAKKHWDVLTTWTDYLIERGLDPENQLCTDDFAGHFAHNANLSIKAILGIASYGRLAEMFGKKEKAQKCMETARSMAKEWVRMADDGNHFCLTFDQPGTWSQKYNLVWDKLMHLNLFPDSVAKEEIAYYLTKQNRYGLPLDNRETYTKADWIIWTATLSPDQATFEKFVAPIHSFMNETVDRVPMTDWYWTDKPNQRGFQARSVVGGFFIKMLEDKMK